MNTEKENVFISEEDMKEAKKALKVEVEGGEPDLTPLVADKKYGTRILIVRHGESMANAVNVFLGHTDLDLSERGYRQAEATAEYLKNEPISVIYSSDLIRAYHTAEPNAKLHSLPINPDQELREIGIGVWENLSIDYIAKNWPNEFLEGWKKNFGRFTPPGGESVEAAGRRFYNRVLEIAKENTGKCILITAHAAVIRVFFAIVSGIDMDYVSRDVPFPANASVTTVYYDSEMGLIPGEFSHSSHLKGI